ncbi:MAG: NAD(+) synthase [Thermoanaerobaculia bacterium]|nr:NAD(+) synthase [Thermoanaerobaculia bacterium]
MQLVRLAAGVLDQTPLDWDGNRDRILEAIRQAREAEVSLLCLPELCIPGYGCEDAFLSPAVEEMSWRVLQEILPACRGMIVSIGLPVSLRHALYNCAALVVDGEIVGLVAKQHLPGDGLHYEPRWFKPWPDDAVAEVVRGDRSYPIGDLHFDCDGVVLGFEICEDAWVASRPGRELSTQGVDIILNPSASHFAFGKQEVRERYVLEGSRAFNVTYLYTNPVGNEAGRAIYDGGALIATGGKLIARGKRLGFEPVSVTHAVVDLELTGMAQARLVSYRPEIEDEDPCRVRSSFVWPELEDAVETELVPAEGWETSAAFKEEEFTRAITLGLFDYLRKSRSYGFVVSLSGGADSAAVACLVRLMVDLAWDELGREGFLSTLDYIPGLGAARTPAEATSRLLTCCYQSTRNSSDTTLNAARAVADAAGARFHHLDVDSLVDSYVGLVEGALERQLTWERDDIALQNIQARVRAPSVWLFANLERALLLATSNRSEAAVGYATMDGDTAGGLSPIAGIDKAFLRRWLRWLETEGPQGRGPIPALSAVNAQQPTAELRPPGEGQTDEGDLMHYDLLDAMERAAIRDKRSPKQVFRLMRGRFPKHSEAQMLEWTERFFRLFSRNQWKRERYAPSFHVDDENLDPKTWCRFPILSGGFDRELRELREAVAKRS